jgi:HK97 family phage major capsid protein/HK97 family phage prohead protease
MVDAISERKMQLPTLSRGQSASMDFDEETRSMTFSFSSETAVERWFGDEVLSHESDAADMARLNDGAPLLWNHNRDEQIGVVERAWIGTDKRGYTKVRFGTSARAEEVLSDIKAGIIRNVSFGYRILEMTEAKRDGKSTFTATRWLPLEVSCVSIPADNSVGIGRSESEASIEQEVLVRGLTTEVKEKKMSDPVPAQPVDVSAVRAEAATDAVRAERDRVSAIRAIGEKLGKADMANSLIDSGRSLEEARAAFLEGMGAQQKPLDSGRSGDVDLSEREQRSYSLVRAIQAAINKDWSGAGLELEVSRTLAKEGNRETEGFFMPLNLRMDAERATYATGATATGGATVATNLLAGSFIEVLRNNTLVMQLGPTMLTGLVGNVAIPRQISQTQTYWVTEGSAITQAEATFDQVTMSPKQLGARSQYSRLMLQQGTPDIEALVRNDLARVMALGIDASAINGTGASGQPRGILNQSGIGSVAMGTNGAAFVNSSPSVSPSGLDPLIDLEGKLDIANALNGTLSYLTNAKVVTMLKKLKDQSGAELWTDDADSTIQGTQGRVNGYAVARSNQVPSNLVKGTSGAVCSALIFGDFTQLLVGMWGGIEILPNPYGAGYNAGAVDIRAMQTVDLAVRHPESFAAITDILAG